MREPVLAPFAAGGADGRTTAVGLKADGRGRLFVAGGATGKLFVLSSRDGSTRQVLGDTPEPPAQAFLDDIALTVAAIEASGRGRR